MVVYIVRPHDPSEDSAVFEHEYDAWKFYETFDNAELETCEVVDNITATRMIADSDSGAFDAATGESA